MRLISPTNETLAVIVGRFRSANSNYDFFQVLDGTTGKLHVTKSLKVQENSRDQVTIDDSHFRADGFEIARSQPVWGKIQFDSFKTWAGWSPHPAMGWLSLVPALQCYHSVLSLRHRLQGELSVFDRRIDFSGGIGYMEKTWGKRFPDAWIWSQCLEFDGEVQSLFLSLATVPVAGHDFTGMTAAVMTKDGGLYRWGSWRLNFASCKIMDETIEVKFHGWHDTLIVRFPGAVPSESLLPNVLVPTTDGLQPKVYETLNQTLELEIRSRTGKVIMGAVGQNAALDLVNIERLVTWLDSPQQNSSATLG